jgi:tetratricopeptide (TPR) repeat protein
MKPVKHIYSLCLLLIFSAAFSSCKKFLDKNPDSSQAVPTTLTDLQALLDNSSRMNIRTTPSFGEASCDDYFLLEDRYNAMTAEDQKIYTWNRGDYQFQNDWSIAYIPVYVANYCLEGIDKIQVNEFNKNSWNNVKGSALFYRSYYFLNLLWVYAKAYDESTAQNDLGIVLRTSSDFNIASKRATVKECYERVISDTKEALIYLPDYPQHVMRPSKTAAFGLLARTYLSMRKYDSAYKYADKSLQLQNSLIDYNADADLNGNVNAALPFKRFNKETIFYTEMNTSYFIHAPFRAKVDTSLYATYASDDLRKAGFFTPQSGYHQFKGSYTETDAQYFTGLATDEILLIRAECNARAGHITEAMQDLNRLLMKRWKNTVPYPVIVAANQTDAIRIILLERRKELYMRGLRWMDIKRLNKENAAIVLSRKIAGQIVSLQPNANYYALPLPADIIQITGIPQN